jgi:nicotinamidase-related amidase
MAYTTLEPAKTALLFFDMLNYGFRGADEATQRRMEPVVAICVRLAQAARGAGIPVVYARADHRPDGLDSCPLYTDADIATLKPWPNPEDKPFRPGQLAQNPWNLQVIDELKPQPGDYVVSKHRWSAFHQTHLDLSLRTRGIDTLMLCGGATDVGVASTAYAARDLDYNLVIVRDACHSSKQDNQDRFMDRIFPFMARVRTADQVIELIRAGSRAPAKKA